GQATCTDAGIYYWVHPPDKPVYGAGVGGGGSAVEYLGNFMHSPSRKPLPGEKITKVKPGPVPKLPHREVRFLPFTGRSARTLKLDLRGKAIDQIPHVFEPEGVYWIDENWNSYYVTAPLGQGRTGVWTEYEPSSTLLYSRYDGSPPVIAASGLASF